jgi:hypothetical protein
MGVLHSGGMKQRDLKNPSCPISSESRLSSGMREENVASLQTYDRRRTMSFSGPKVFDMRLKNAARYQTCGRRRAVPFS